MLYEKDITIHDYCILVELESAFLSKKKKKALHQHFLHFVVGSFYV